MYTVFTTWDQLKHHMDEDFTESDMNENTLEDSSTKKRKLEVAFVGDVVKLSKIVDFMRRAKLQIREAFK